MSKLNNFFFKKSLYSKVNLGFFTRNGGVSSNLYKSLNCNKKSGDELKNIKKNLIISKQKLNIINKELKLINQKHSNIIKIINKKNINNNLNGDGLFTKDKNIALAILTADCAPVFIFDNDSKFICCLHIGWKGALKNIAKKSVEIFCQNLIKKKDIIVVIGPCLSKKNFEVDKNFLKKFIQIYKNYKLFFTVKNKEKYLFDLRKLINLQFRKCGVKNIYNIKKDTYSNEHLFFSHRRACHKKQDKNGRMINIISFI